MRHPWSIGWIAGALALPFVGAGPMNGDQAVYLDQAARGAWFERWTHVGYVALHAGWGTSWRSDLLCVFVGMVGLAVVAQRRGWTAGAVLAAVVLPWMPFGEVDVLWFVALAIAASGWHAAAALGVLVSPTALAGLPWMAARYGVRSLIVPAVCVVSLVLASNGDWLVGRRGVATSSWSLAPHWQVLPGVVAALVLARRPRGVELLALTPVLFAPSDVPAGWLGVLAVVYGRPLVVRVPGVLRLAVGGLLAAASLGLLVHTSARVRRENTRIQQLASDVSPADEVRGPWSWRVRLALVATGRSDGFRGTGARIVQLPSGEVSTRQDTPAP